MLVHTWQGYLSNLRALAAAACAAALLVGAGGVTPVHAEIISPTATIAGLSQLQHAHLWWQTMLNIPAATNPILDTTGANAHLGQQPGNVLYLGGGFDPTTNRSASVPPGTTLFLPLINAFWDNTNLIGQPPFNMTPQEMLDITDAEFDNVVSLFLEIDGQPVSMSQLLLHRQTTDPNAPHTTVIQAFPNLVVDIGYDPTLGTADPFDPASYPTSIFPFVVDGYWVGLSPFAPGSTHTIRFGAVLPGGFSQDNTFVITTTPEPASWLVWGAVMSGLAFVAYRRRLRRSAIQARSASE